MIEITSNNARHIRPLSPAEIRAKEAWFANQSTAQILELKLQRGGRFCVVQGDYKKRSTDNMVKGLKYLAEIGSATSPAARYLAKEIAKRRRGVYSFCAPTDPNGPQAA